MNPEPFSSTDLYIRSGFEFVYEAAAPTPAVFLINPRLDAWQKLYHEELHIEHAGGKIIAQEDVDSHGNVTHRFTFPIGRSTIRHDFFITSPSTPENIGQTDGAHAVEDLPIDILRYTLPSRYCDSDRLRDFANATFGHLARGIGLVQAICDWTHDEIAYRWGAGSPNTAASEIVAQRFGVCRDFAHTSIALCRCFNIPARYQTGYVPDIAYLDSGTPMDFHAYMQVYVGGQWQTFDSRFNVPRTGRIHIATGLDAVDGAFATLFGPAQMVWFNVWSYQIDPDEVRPGDPVDLTKRLCGTEELFLPPRVK